MRFLVELSESVLFSDFSLSIGKHKVTAAFSFSGHKRPGDHNNSSLAKKQKRTPKRASTVAKNEKNGTGLFACNDSGLSTPT